MFRYSKRLQYPINIKKKDLNMAKYLVTQYGGSNGELLLYTRHLQVPGETPATSLSSIHQSHVPVHICAHHHRN